MVDAVDPAGIWSPFGAFSMAVIQGDGQVVHLKGQVALDQQGQIVGAQDMRVQVRKVLENIQAVLASMGGRMGDVVSLVHHATDIERFMGTGDIRKEFFAAPFGHDHRSSQPAIPPRPADRDHRDCRDTARAFSSPIELNQGFVDHQTRLRRLGLLPGQQLVETLLRVSVHHLAQHVAQPGIRLEPVQLGGLDQQRHHRPTLRTSVAARKQGILSSMQSFA